MLEKGWSKEKKAFVQHYESDAMDAATLLLPLLGFIDFNDPRFISTLERIEAELRDGPSSVVTGRMKRTTACSAPRARSSCAASGLSRCSPMSVARAEARRMFNELLTYANHLGLFAEMIDPRSGLALGNFPQAFTHIGLILAALESTWHEDDSEEGDHREHHDHASHTDHDHHGD